MVENLDRENKPLRVRDKVVFTKSNWDGVHVGIIVHQKSSKLSVVDENKIENYLKECPGLFEGYHYSIPLGSYIEVYNIYPGHVLKL